jgi:hypothetical protein
MDGAKGMVFLRYWRAKKSKDAIPQCCGDPAFIALHGTHHQAKGWPYDARSKISITLPKKLH